MCFLLFFDKGKATKILDTLALKSNLINFSLETFSLKLLGKCYPLKKKSHHLTAFSLKDTPPLVDRQRDAIKWE